MYVIMLVSFHSRPYVWNASDRSPLGRVYSACVSGYGSAPKKGPQCSVEPNDSTPAHTR